MTDMTKTMPRITRRAAIAGLSCFAVMPALAKGAWPERPITLIHGFPPGGPVDVLARILAEPMSKSLGQPLTVESKPGATGMTAAGFVAHAAPDGYTLLALPGTFTAASALFKTLPYNPAEDFTFISSTAEAPLVLVTHPESEFHTLADVVRIARRARDAVAVWHRGRRIDPASDHGAFRQAGEHQAPAHSLQGRLAGHHRSCSASVSIWCSIRRPR